MPAMYVYRLDQVRNKRIVIQVQTSACRKFIGFDSYDQFEFWYNQIPFSSRHSFEVIRDGPQRFRLDVDNDEPVDVTEVVNHLSRFLAQLGVDSVRIMACGNVTEPPNRPVASVSDRGYHVVLISPVLHSSDAARSLAEGFIRHGKDQTWVKHLDRNVYKQTQCFRLLGSTKYRCQRWKSQMFVYSRKGQADRLETLPFQTALRLSMCSYVGSHPNVQHMPVERNSIARPIGDRFVTLDRIGRFRIRHLQKNLIVLDSLQPYHCPRCQRVHASENPYLVVREGSLTFHCRRS